MKNISKLITLMAAVSLTSSAWAMTSLPNGNWAGTGKYTTSKGDTGTYDVKVSVKDNVVDKEVTAGKQVFKMEAKVTLDANGFGSADLSFTDKKGVAHTAKVSGSCGEDVCSWWSEKLHFGDTIAFHEKDIYTFGGESRKGVNIRWQEKLSKTDFID